MTHVEEQDWVRLLSHNLTHPDIPALVGSSKLASGT